jgi:hypothetical protein
LKRRPSAQKRSREQLKAERRKEKAERRNRRKEEKLSQPTPENSTEDPDLAGIDSGPQLPASYETSGAP